MCSNAYVPKWYKTVKGFPVMKICPCYNPIASIHIIWERMSTRKNFSKWQAHLGTFYCAWIPCIFSWGYPALLELVRQITLGTEYIFFLEISHRWQAGALFLAHSQSFSCRWKLICGSYSNHAPTPWETHGWISTVCVIFYPCKITVQFPILNGAFPHNSSLIWSYKLAFSFFLILWRKEKIWWPPNMSDFNSQISRLWS